MRFTSSLAALCVLTLTACGGGGTGSTSPQSPQSGNKVFIGDNRSYKMVAVDTLTPNPGALSAKIFRSGATTWLGAAFDGTHDELYVAAWTQIDIYANASQLDGEINAARSIMPKINGRSLSAIIHVVLDKTNDRLYAGYDGGIAVFDQVSKLSGTVSPTRLITGPFNPARFGLDPKRGILYSCSSTGSPCDLSAFDHIDTANGSVKPYRTITIRNLVEDLSVDASRDRLYIAAGEASIAILDNASTASSGATPIYVKVPTYSQYAEATAITVDAANDRVYAGFTTQALVLDSASKLAAGSATAQAVAITAPNGTNISYFAVPQ